MAEFPRQELSDMSVGLLMTYRCNLDCRYCYIHKKQEKNMSLEMAQSILEPFLNMYGGLLDIKFMGGETLLSIDVIIPLVEWIKKKSWNRRYRFFGSTNGTLLNDYLKDWLFENREIITLGLSYDGTPSAQSHNRTSKNIDIDFFAKAWPHQPIQMTINKDSVNNMAAGIKYILSRNVPVHPNVAFETEEWPLEYIGEYRRQLMLLIDYYLQNPSKYLIDQFRHDLNEYAENLENPPTKIQICGAGNGSQVFDVDGRSYMCHILSPLVLNNNQLEGVSNEPIAEYLDITNTQCYCCPYVSSCPTCIACNYLYRGGILNRDRTHCRIMRTEVDIFIKREVERLRNKNILTSDDATEIDSIIKLLAYNRSVPL